MPKKAQIHPGKIDRKSGRRGPINCHITARASKALFVEWRVESGGSPRAPQK